MPNDVFYGSDALCRFGIMADAITDPTVWWGLEFVSLTLSPTRQRTARPKMGQGLNNPIDPTKPVPGFYKFAGALVLDADSRMLPLVLRAGIGPSVDTGPSSGIYTHTWKSGGVTPAYFALQVRFNGDTAPNPVRVLRGMTFGSISASATGEQVQNFDLSLALRGLTRARVSDWLSGTVNAVPAESPMSRAQILVDGTAASNTLQASYSWDRLIAEDTFLTTAPNVSGLRPSGGALKGSAQFRALATTFDDDEEGDVTHDYKLQMLGVTSGHEIDFEHPCGLLDASPIDIKGPALLERTISWTGYQQPGSPGTPGAVITVKNDVAAYA